jgi:hypothetical protein
MTSRDFNWATDADNQFSDVLGSKALNYASR